MRAGDIGRAQAAADALELDALLEHNAARPSGASTALLDELVALLSGARSVEESGARALALSVSEAPEPAVIVPPDAYADMDAPDDGGAAYDTLRHYLEGEPGVA